ncbi:MAG TPA: cyclic 2,3-diphosphoglycerate synthase [Xanthobacteraceae bacterium]|nr:cyclic 2,3-diphosphoglycerate synthase [Xanthobacteraceae bacterium]
MDAGRPSESDAAAGATDGHRRRIIIVGAAGRDFHNFNVVYRGDPGAEVVAFTAAQIPGIADRRYPAELAGPYYPDGIPIAEESRLEALCRAHAVDEVIFAYSDVPHQHVMHIASRALAAGADFTLLGPRRTMLSSSRPVIAVTAVRTGCGKSPLARWLSRTIRERGFRVAVLRHPMPYGELATQRVQRFASLADLDAAQCSAEEREEYEPHIAAGGVVFAGVDYAEILQWAEVEAQIIVWDGGNNDFPFVRPDLHITVADALRPRQVATHHPGETVARMADVLVVNKVDSATAYDIDLAERELRAVNSRAVIVRAASPIRLDDPAAVRGKRALVVEDGPTITHGGMPHGAGYLAAIAAGADIVDPRPAAAPAIRAVFEAFPHIGKVLPAVGYGAAQREALRQTLNASDADVIVSATPVDLARLLHPDKTVVRARYEFAESGERPLSLIVETFIERVMR